MKFSLNWLREFLDLPDKIDHLADLLTLAGVEIEGIEMRGAKIDNIIVAQITASSQHPTLIVSPFAKLTMAAEQNVKSFAARPIIKSVTKFRSRFPAQSCRTVWRFEKANCAALNRKECFAATKSSGLATTLADC